MAQVSATGQSHARSVRMADPVNAALKRPSLQLANRGACWPRLSLDRAAPRGRSPLTQMQHQRLRQESLIDVMAGSLG